MDTLSTALTSSGAVLATALAYKIWTMIKGKRLISDCCGKKLEVGVDVRDMPHSPTELEMTSPHPSHQVLETPEESRHGFALREKKRRAGSESEVSEQKHQPQIIVVEDIVLVSSGSASSASKECGNGKDLPSDKEPSLPQSVSK
jgi:hypothetical protein